jgi:hypothetical protein
MTTGHESEGIYDCVILSVLALTLASFNHQAEEICANVCQNSQFPVTYSNPKPQEEKRDPCTQSFVTQQ